MRIIKKKKRKAISNKLDEWEFQSNGKAMRGSIKLSLFGRAEEQVISTSWDQWYRDIVSLYNYRMLGALISIGHYDYMFDFLKPID